MAFSVPNRFILLSCLLLVRGAYLFAQCNPAPPLNIPDNFSNPPVNNPPPALQHCVTLNVNPASTGHPTGISMFLDHDWQGDLSIRINACGGTLMLLTRPGGGNCNGGLPFGSSADLNGTYTFSDGGGPNPDLGLPLTGGNFGLSSDPCGVNNQLNAFASLAGLCGNNPYSLQLCFVDHAGVNMGTASQIRLIFPSITCGCTDPDALNYLPQANTDDGSCVYPQQLGCGAVFTDSGGPGGNYSNNENIITRICPDDPAQVVTVTFTAFNVETLFDKLYVYNGPNTNSPPILSNNGVGAGTSCPQAGGFWGTALPGPFTGSGPGACLTFRFCSDPSFTQAGWIANVTCSTPCIPPSAPMVSGMTIPPGTSTQLNASGCETGTIRWFSSANGGTPLATGPSFTTPVLQVSTTYYVECSTGTNCHSPRTPVLVSVQAPPALPPCGAGNWSVRVYNDINFTAFMGYYVSPGHPADGGDDPADAEFNSFKDGITLTGTPSQVSSYIGLPVSPESFGIRASRCGFPCGRVYDIRALNYDDFVSIKVDQNGDGIFEFDYADGPPAGGSAVSLWTGVLGPQSRVELSGYKVGPQHPQFQEPAQFMLQVLLLNDQTQAALTANAGDDQISCPPASVIIGGSPTAALGLGPYTYLWSPAAGLSNSNVANPTANPANTTSYTVTVTDATGCTATDDILISTQLCCGALAGSISILPESPCPGSTLTVSVSGNQTNSAYQQRFILTDAAGNVLQFRESGDFTLPNQCGSFRIYSYNYLPGPGVITNPTNISQISCAAPICCDISDALAFVIDGTYTIPPNTASTVPCLQQLSPPTAPIITYPCGSVLSSSGPLIGPDPICGGTQTYTWQFTDCQGNTFPWVHTVTVDQPSTTMPPNGSGTVSCLADATPPLPPTITDNCGQLLTATGPVVATIPGCTGSRTYTWTYTDCSANSYTWVYTYQLSAPGVTMPPPASTVVACLQQIVPPTPPNITDNCGNLLSVTGPAIAVPTACSGEQIYSWTYADCLGLTYVWTHTFVVSAPVVDMPAPGMGALSCRAAAVMPTPPEVVDNCGRLLSRSGPVIDDAVVCEGVLVYTWTYTDCLGNQYSWPYSYLITLPLVNMPPGGSSSVFCLAEAIVPVPPIVMDACSNALTITGPAITEEGDCPSAVVYTWTYTDCAGREYPWSYTFSLIEPVITMPPLGEMLIACPDDAIAPVPPLVMDQCGLALSVTGPFISGGQTCLEDILYTWVYRDCLGREYPWQFRYQRLTPGVIMPPEETVYVSCYEEAIEPQPPILQDNCGAILSLSGPMITNANTCSGERTYTWTYQDCSGALYTWRYTYIVSGGFVPLIPPDESIDVSCVQDVYEPISPDIYDSCGQLLSKSGPVISAPVACGGVMTYTWTYMDCQGNNYAWSYHFSVAPPEISIQCPSALTFCESNTGIYTIPPAQAIDNCNQPTALSFTISGATNRIGTGANASGVFAAGNATITWESQHPCGQVQACITLVEIKPIPDFQLTEISCAPDLGSYSISFQSSADEYLLNPMMGTISGNQVSGIPTGQNISITPVRQGCPGLPILVNAPDCSCPTIPVPIPVQNNLVRCSGDDLPIIQANIPTGFTVNWYNAPSGGQLLQQASNTYQSTGAGTYYAEGVDPETGCSSALRVAITVQITPSTVPAFDTIGPLCAGTAFSLPSTSLQGISGTWHPGPDINNTTTYTFTPNTQLYTCAETVSLTVTIDEQPELLVTGITCDPDLSHYAVQFMLSGGTLIASAGVLSPNAVMTIPSGQDLLLRASNGTNPQCDVVRTIIAPDCSCPDIAAPELEQASLIICAGDTLPSFRATTGPGLVLRWYFGNTLVQAGGNTFTPAQAGTYEVIAVDTVSGCQSTDIRMITLAIEAIVDPIFSPVGPLCSGTVFQLPNVSINGIQGTWTPAINVNQTTQYRFNPDSQLHTCANPYDMTVHIDQQPQLELNGISCAADLQTYQVTLSASGGQLSTTGGQLQGQLITGIPAGQDIVISHVHPTNPQCQVILAISAPDCNCPQLPPPVLNLQTITVCAHDSIPEISAQAASGLLVNWYNQAIGGEPFLTNTRAFRPTLSGIYFAEALDPETGCVSQREAVQVDITPSSRPVFDPVPPICAGTAFTLPGVSVNGIAGSWTPAPDAFQTLWYRFSPDTMAEPCALSDSVLIRVDELPGLSIAAAWCSPDLEQYQLALNFSGGLLSATAGTINNQLISGIPAGQSLTISVVNPENSNCFVEILFAGLDCDCVPIDAPELIDAERAICVGDSMPMFSAIVPTGISVIWYDALIGGNELQVGGLDFTPGQAGTYYVEAVDTLTGCRSQTRSMLRLQINNVPTIQLLANRTTICAGETVQLSASGALQYVWNDGFNGSQRSLSPLAPVQLVVVGTDENGCTGADSLWINVIPRPVATANPAEICLGDSTWLAASGGQFYTWSTGQTTPQILVSPPTTTAYTVTVTDEGCSSVITVWVQVNALPQAAITAGTTTICSGQELALMAMGGVQYRWDNDETGAVRRIQGQESRRFLVTVTNTAGCTDTAGISISVVEQPTFEYQVSNLGCYGDDAGEITITRISGGVPPYRVQLQGGAAVHIGQLPFTAGQDLPAGSYVVTMADQGQCSNRDTIIVNPAPELRVDLGMDRSIRLGDTVDIIAELNFMPTVMSWSPDRWILEQEQLMLRVNPPFSTRYQLRAYHENGCYAEAGVMIRVRRELEVYVPNAFSPDNNQVNDRFMVYASDKVQEIKSFSIVNRWGEEVFHARNFPPNDPAYGWDGTFRGSRVNPDVLVWYMVVRYPDGKEELLKGDLLLIR